MNITAHRQTASGSLVPKPMTSTRFAWAAASAAAILILVVSLSLIVRPSAPRNALLDPALIQVRAAERQIAAPIAVVEEVENIRIPSSLVAPPGSGAADSPRTPPQSWLGTGDGSAAEPSSIMAPPGSATADSPRN